MAVNSLKQLTESLIAEKTAGLKEAEILQQIQEDKIDITLPANRGKYGTLHPLTVVQQKLKISLSVWVMLLLKGRK